MIKYYSYLILFVLFIVVVSLSGCILNTSSDISDTIQETNKEITNNNSVKITKGITLSPKSFSQDDFYDFLKNVDETGDIISWSGDWAELSNTKNSGPVVITELSYTYNYIPVIEAQFFTQSSGKLLRPLDEKTKQDYKNNVLSFVEKYKPKYLGLGMEVNVLSEKTPEDFDIFVSLYNEIYDAVKVESSDTNPSTQTKLNKTRKKPIFEFIQFPQNTLKYLYCSNTAYKKTRRITLEKKFANLYTAIRFINITIILRTPSLDYMLAKRMIILYSFAH